MKKNRAPRTIGIVFNLKKKGATDDRYEEYDELATIQAVEAELTGFGFKVLRFEQTPTLSARLQARRPDFVLNIAEGLGDGRSRESQVPCLLESLDIPYSGSDPLALGLTLDKYLTFCMLRSAGVNVPEMFLARGPADLPEAVRWARRVRRYIVKPRWEGSSKGVFLDSFSSRPADLPRLVRRIWNGYRQPAVVEEFLPGAEITAGVCGNRPARLLGMMKIEPRRASAKPFVYSIENKRDWEARIRYLPGKSIEPGLRARIGREALRAFAALELRDVARVDFRLTADMTPKIIDVNPLPGLSPRYSDLPILYRLKGRSFRELLGRILAAALGRRGFSLPEGTRG